MLRRPLQSLLPVGAYGIVPIALLYAQAGLVLRFPATLPMLRSGIAYAGYQEYAPTWGGVICVLLGHVVVVFCKGRKASAAYRVRQGLVSAAAAWGVMGH